MWAASVLVGGGLSSRMFWGHEEDYGRAMGMGLFRSLHES